MPLLVRRVLAALSGAAIVCCVVPAAEGSVTVSQKFTVPTSGKFVAAGHGFGHGHGMSQYGANGAAKQGLTSAKILAFYYPGTKPESITGYVKVLISADTSTDVIVKPASGLRVRDNGSGTTYPLPTDLGATTWRLTVSGAKTVVQYAVGGSWRSYRPGGLTALVGDGQFQSSAGRLTLVLPGNAERVYRGSLLAASPKAGSTARDTVNVLAIDDYVKGVVPAEMPASWEPAAVQSQAVAARTYAWWSRAQNLTRYYQICDTTACQVYAGAGREVSAANTAVGATKGRILTYSGKPAFTQFSASSGGWTSAGSVAYLPHKADPYDAWSGNRVHDWTASLDESVVERAYPAIGDLVSITVTRREGDGQWSGRVESLTLTGAKGSQVITGNTFRSLYGLRSSWFAFR